MEGWFESVLARRLGSLAVLAGVLVAGVARGEERLEPRRLLGYVAMADGTRLPYAVYLPAQGERFPVLMTYDPYAGGGMDLTPPRGVEMSHYLERGYAVMGASLRGTGCAQGFHEFQSPRIAEDGAALVDWAARQPWSDGNVGLFGYSYSGMTAFLVGGQRPPHLRAIAVGAPPSQLYEEIFYPGGIFNFAMSGVWTFRGQPGSAKRGIGFRIAAGDVECATHVAAQRPHRMFQDQRDHALYDEWWSSRSVIPSAARVAVPTLLFHAWQDEQIAVSGGLDLFAAVQGPKRIVLGNGRHAFYLHAAFDRERGEWFDRWLRRPPGPEQRPAQEQGAEVPVSVRFEDPGSGAPGWIWNFGEWPPAAVVERVFHLTGEGRLISAEPQGAAAGSREYLYPLGTESLASAASYRVGSPPFGTLVYRSEPLESDLAVLGAPSVELRLESELPDLDLMLVLRDVWPDGGHAHVQRGLLRVSHRSGHAQPRPLLPGTPESVRVKWYPVGHVFRRGHFLEMAVLAPPVSPTPNWGFALRTAPGLVRVHHGNPGSRLSLPVLPGRAAEAPSPDCGRLPNQPCRPKG